MTRNPKLGITSLFIASIFYGSYGILSRLIGDAFGNFNQNWIRNIFVVIFITTVIFIHKTRLLSFKKEDVKWILLWFFSGSWITVLTFIVFNKLQIGTTYLLLYSGMIIAGFLSGRIFFNERLNKLKTMSLVFTFIGLFIIYRFTLGQDQIFYFLLGLISGFMTGTWNTISKKFSDNYPNSQMVLMDATSSIVAAYIGSILFREHLPIYIHSISWIWVIVYAMIQTINVGLIVHGFKNVEAQIGSIILPVEIVFATIFSYVIFQEIPTFLTVIGGSLIILGALFPSLRFFTERLGIKRPTTKI